MKAGLIARASALATAGLMLAGTAQAIDVSPGDYAWVGDGRTLFLTYGQFQTADEFLPDGAAAVPDSKLSLSLLLLRGVHYREIGGQKFSFQAILPIGRFGTARIGGADAPVTDGIGDLTLGATWYPLASAEPTGTTLGITAFLTAPTGAYEFGEVSLGSGTWTLTPQVGLIQGLGGGFYFDGILDVALQADHDEGGVEVSRDPSVQAQGYLRWQASPQTSVSVGYSGLFGGETHHDGVYTGLKTRSDQVKIFANTFFDETSQVQLMLAKDVKVEGGFKSDTVVQLRYLKVF